MASRPPQHSRPAPDPARARFVILNGVRVTGALLVVAGLLVLNGKLGLSDAAGWVFVGVGLVEVFALPPILVRRWRTPPA